MKELVLPRQESRVGSWRDRKVLGCKDRGGGRLAWSHKDMETAWEAEQTMSLQVSYLYGGNEVGASAGGSQSPMLGS